jgi:chitin disaccharide deacetylase
MMRGMIVNADDFGLSPGVNRGIAQAHRNGVVTSTSLLVDTPFSAHAAALGSEMPALSIGLHVDLSTVIAGAEGARVAAICAAELERQIRRFHSLTGRWPTHLDSHRNVHRREDLVDSFLQVGRSYGLRVREHSGVTYVSAFYGQWGGSTHLEQISVEGLERVLRTCSDHRLVELACHPGYLDDALRSSYRTEREVELHTLSDERLPRILEDLGLTLLDSELRLTSRM